MVARIKGCVSEEMLQNAIAKVQQRHALLRVRIQDDKDHAQWFTSEEIQEIPIEVVARKSENDWIKVHVEASRIPFEFETRPAIRFILLLSPEVSDLIILCHHMICDGMSLAYLARDLMVYLGDPSREVEVLPAPAPITLENLPGDVAHSFLVMNFKKLGRLVCPESTRYEKLSAFSRRDDVVLRLLKRDHLESLVTKHWGTAVTNLGRLNFPRSYGAL